MDADFQFDAFFSHSAKDKTVVRPLAERLRSWAAAPDPRHRDPGLRICRIRCMTTHQPVSNATLAIGSESGGEAPVKASEKPVAAPQADDFAFADFVFNPFHVNHQLEFTTLVAGKTKLRVAKS